MARASKADPRSPAKKPRKRVRKPKTDPHGSWAGHGGKATKYNAKRPQEILDFFQSRVAQITEPQKTRNKLGDVKWVTKPVRLPLLYEFAASIGVCTDTLHEWALHYPEFAEAKKIGQDIQTQMLVQLGLLGAYASSTTIFTLKNIAQWTDRGEINMPNGVTLVFDAQDERA